MHIVAGCKVYLEEKGYTWRHDSVLNYIAKSLSALQGCQLFADLDGWMSPCTISGQDHRPDLLVVKGNKLYVLELTVSFESNIEINRNRKQRNLRGTYQVPRVKLRRSQFCELIHWGHWNIWQIM